jgi:hypothetical protein
LRIGSSLAKEPFFQKTYGPKNQLRSIDQLALENDFLAGALGRIDGASAKK